MLTDIERTEKLRKFLRIVNVIIGAKHVEEGRFSKAPWPEEHVCERPVDLLEVLDVHCLIGEQRPCLGTEVEKFRMAKWDSPLLRWPKWIKAKKKPSRTN